MNLRPCATPCATRAPKRRALPVILALLALAALTCPAAAALAEDDRGLGAGPAAPVRHVVVKAVGHGVNAEDAEMDALRSVRLMAAKHYAALGGAAALDASPQGLRVLATHHTPPMGLATVRSVALVELRLRALPEPPPAALALPVLRVNVDASQVQVQANLPCEILVALDYGDALEPEILPGGSGAVYRLAPDKPMRQPLPWGGAPASLRVLACTGGLAAPAAAPTVDEAFAKARPGKPRPTTMQGVVSECVETRTALSSQRDKTKGSTRQ